MSNAKFKPTLLGVCVRGPDDVIPAPDFDTARRWANRMNALTDAAAKRRIDDEHMPICNSVVIRWPYDAESHAEGPGDDDKWLLDEEEAAPSMPTWQPIETAPKDILIDIWLSEGVRWCGCHYDRITDQWRINTPFAPMRWVPARAATHWMPIPDAPKTDVPA